MRYRPRPLAPAACVRSAHVCDVGKSVSHGLGHGIWPHVETQEAPRYRHTIARSHMGWTPKVGVGKSSNVWNRRSKRIFSLCRPSAWHSGYTPSGDAKADANQSSARCYKVAYAPRRYINAALRAALVLRDALVALPVGLVVRFLDSAGHFAGLAHLVDPAARPADLAGRLADPAYRSAGSVDRFVDLVDLVDRLAGFLDFA